MTRPSRGPRGRARAGGEAKCAAPSNSRGLWLPRDGGAARGGYLRRGGGCRRAKRGGAEARPWLPSLCGSRVLQPGPAALRPHSRTYPLHPSVSYLQLCNFSYCLQLHVQPPFTVTGGWPGLLQRQLEKLLVINIIKNRATRSYLAICKECFLFFKEVFAFHPIYSIFGPESP